MTVSLRIFAHDGQVKPSLSQRLDQPTSIGRYNLNIRPVERCSCLTPASLKLIDPLLDIPTHTKTVTLLEGNTPLIPVPAVAEALGGGFDLFVKFEGLNPTGSFKDRGMTVAISEAAGRNVKTVMCASTGNTAASAAAYAARAGMKCLVLIPEGKVATGKLAGAVAYGAKVLQIKGSFDDALTLVVSLTNRTPIALVNSLNPYRLEGQKTGAFEICDVLGNAPDWLCLPVGNAGNISAYWMGFKQYQIPSSKPLYRRFLEYRLKVQRHWYWVTRLNTRRRSRQRSGSVNQPEVNRHCRLQKNRHGKIIAVSDEEILSAQRLLAASGVWVEPASAAGIAGLRREIEQKKIDPRGKRIVAICTGHGLKDPDIVTRDFTYQVLAGRDECH